MLSSTKLHGQALFFYLQENYENYFSEATTSTHNIFCGEFLFVLRFLLSSQPNGAISSTVSLLSHTFTRQT